MILAAYGIWAADAQLEPLIGEAVRQRRADGDARVAVCQLPKAESGYHPMLDEHRIISVTVVDKICALTGW